VGREIHECTCGAAEAMRQQRRMACVVLMEVMKEQVRRRENYNQEPNDEGDHEEWSDDRDCQDRERPAQKQDGERDGRDAKRPEDREASYQSVFLALLGW
jgi:predicted phage gp36 major capsid-like protein